MPQYLTIPIAFLLGFALARVATCTVAATARAVEGRKPDWLFGLTIVVSWAGLALLAFSAATGQAHLPVNLAIGWPMIVGGMVMGVGALINRGCFIGTVGYIGSGRFCYIFTFFGLGAAMFCTFYLLPPLFEQTRLPRTALEDSIAKQASIVLFAVLATVSVWLLVARQDKAMAWLALVGISAALLFGSAPEWAYSAVIGSIVRGQGFAQGYIIELAVAALFAGAIVSSILKDRFKPSFGGWRVATGNFVGGFLMGIGAAWVPGGNDILLMWTIPGMAAYGVVAYLVMIATIAGAMVLMRRLRPSQG